VNAVDRTVDTLLVEKNVVHERLPASARDGWRDIVQDVLTRRGLLSAAS